MYFSKTSTGLAGFSVAAGGAASWAAIEARGAALVKSAPEQAKKLVFLTGGVFASHARDYVNATVGFQDLEKRTHIPAKSLMRMLGPKGSPSAANLTTILGALQKTEGVHFELALRR